MHRIYMCYALEYHLQHCISPLNFFPNAFLLFLTCDFSFTTKSQLLCLCQMGIKLRSNFHHFLITWVPFLFQLHQKFHFSNHMNSSNKTIAKYNQSIQIIVANTALQRRSCCQKRTWQTISLWDTSDVNVRGVEEAQLPM